MTTTPETLRELRDAQLRHAIDHINGALQGTISDDSTDYLIAALDLASELVSLDYDEDTAQLDEILTADLDHDIHLLNRHACDGIAPAIYTRLKEV